jgi:hypothetical protein
MATPARQRRSPTALPVLWIRKHRITECQAVDINQHGMLLRTDERVLPGALLQLEVTIERLLGPIGSSGRSCGELIVMMKPAEDRSTDDCAKGEGRVGRQGGTIGGRRSALADALVWPRVVEEAGVLVEDPLQVSLVQHEHMIETLTAERSDESLDMTVGLGRHHRCPHDVNPCALGDSIKGDAELRIVVAQQILGPVPKGLSSRSRWASHSLVGACVATAHSRRRDSRCMTTNTKWQRSQRSRTSRRSQHQIDAA